MVELPAVQIPWELSTLLQIDFSKGERSDVFNKVYRFLSSSPHLTLIIDRAFKHIVPPSEIKQFLKYLGWKNFRDRLSSVYLYYYQHGFYPNETQPILVNKIIKIEQRLEAHTLEGHSRVFLLFFYFALSEIYYKKHDDENSAQQIIEFTPKIFSLLQYSQSKILYIDWLILFLWHLEKFWGYARLDKTISDNHQSADYWAIWSILDEHQQHSLMINMLSYGHSIGQPQFFKEMIV